MAPEEATWRPSAAAGSRRLAAEGGSAHLKVFGTVDATAGMNAGTLHARSGAQV